MDFRGTSARRWTRDFARFLVLAAFYAAWPAAAGNAPRQVQIEARLVEMNRAVAEELGFDWSAVQAPPSPTAPSVVNLGPSISPSQITAMLAGASGTRVLANPKVTTIEGQAATIEVGGQIPFSQPENPASASYEDFTIDLQLVPEVVPDGTIRFQIQSAVDGVAGLGGSNPRIETRTTATRVAIRDGESFAIAGLLQDDARTYADKVPILRDLPVLGRFFDSSDFQQGRTTLALILSPEILGGGGPQQVQIEAKFLGVGRESAHELGIDLESPWSGLQTHTVDTDALARILGSPSSAEVLANPKVSTLSGNAASVQVGGEIPVPSGGTAVEYQDFGVKLDFTPRVSADSRYLRLDIQPTVSEIDTSQAAPELKTRRLSTNVELRDGQTLVIAGLLREDFAEEVSRVPRLANIPGLGTLFRAQDDLRRDRELMVFLTPTLYDEEGRPVSGGGGAPPVAVSGPRFSVGGTGGYYRRDLPGGNGGLGVVGAGNPDEEDAFLEYPTVINAGGGGVQFVAPVRGLGPGVGIVVDGWYAGGDATFDDEVEGQIGVVNGITYWQQTDDMPMPFDGISQDGAGLMGEGRVRFSSARFFTGLQIDATPLFDPVIDEICDAPLQDRIGDAPWSARPSFLFSAVAGFDYQEQDSWSDVRILYDSVAIESLDVHTRNDIDLEEWSTRARFRLDYVQPVPKVRGLSFVTGAGFGLGYRTASADASQHNFCDIRTTMNPGINSCTPGSQDFEISNHYDDDGFDWDVSAGARIEYDFAPFATGVTASVGYDFDYLGVSRFRTPTNLPQDGSPAVEHEHEPLHRVGVEISVNF